MAADAQCPVIVLHACANIESIRKEIVQVSTIARENNKNKKYLFSVFKNLVLKHIQFIEFCKNIQDIYSTVSFFHIFLITFLQVVSGYMFLEALEGRAKTVNLFHYAILTLSFLLSAGYYCIAGEYLSSQSHIIFDELYNCYWYEFTNGDSKTINFMLAKAKIPVNLSVGKFSHLSLTYLTSIMKSSFSYLSLVRAVR